MFDKYIKIEEEENSKRIPLKESLPLIRCTFPKPCGKCWYCLEHKKLALAIQGKHPKHNGNK